MCWSIEVSAAAAVCTWFVCAYLYRRNLHFDRWGAAYLFTFTLTQLVDIGLWLDEGRVGLSTCSNVNYGWLIVLLSSCRSCANKSSNNVSPQEYPNFSSHSQCFFSIMCSASILVRCLRNIGSISLMRICFQSSEWLLSSTVQVSIPMLPSSICLIEPYMTIFALSKFFYLVWYYSTD